VSNRLLEGVEGGYPDPAKRAVCDVLVLPADEAAQRGELGVGDVAGFAAVTEVVTGV